MRYPEFLQPGGSIGFVAPSFGCDTEPYKSQFARALQHFEEMGYRTVLGPNCYASAGIGKSNTPELCGAEINEFLAEGRSDIVISCGGGETMCEDLPFVDFDAIRNAKPRWYMGFSDNTNLCFLLPTLCDTAAVYGPCAGSFGMEPWHPALADALGILTGEKLCVSNYNGWESESLKDESNPYTPYNITQPYGLRIVNGNPDGRFSGRLLGGCLDCLQIFCGTRFDKVKEFNERYRTDGVIWFMEACDLNPMSIRRALWQLDNAGWFESAKGFIIGRSLHFGEEQMGMNPYNAYTGILEKYGVPILLDADLGHLPPMMPLVEGALAEVNVAPGSLRIEQKLCE